MPFLRSLPFFACLALLAPSGARAQATPLPSPADPASAAPERPDAATMFARVRDAVDALPSPPYVAFTLEDESTTKYALEQERLRLLVRVADGRTLVRVFRDVSGNPADDPAPRLETTTDVPESFVYRAGDFPLADFGLKRIQIRPGIFDAEGTPDPAPASGLRVLTTVTAVSPSYRLTDLGDTEIDGRLAYHLGLLPIRDPGHHVLRQMWIDPATSLPLRYVADRYVGTRGAAFHYLVTVNTALVNGVLANVDSDGRYDYRYGLVFHVKGEGRWRISRVAFPASVPDWAMDPALLRSHRHDAIAELESP